MSDAQISIGKLLPVQGRRARLAGTLLVPVGDWLLGLRTIDGLYRRHRFAGLGPFEFIERTLEVLRIRGIDRRAELAQSLPRQGPLLIVCNHPYGGIEALLLAQALGGLRPDLRFLANQALGVFPEIAPLLVGTNPLSVTQRNLPSLRACERHLSAGGALVVFPAGKVSFLESDGQRTVDAEWNRIVGHLALKTSATLLPVYFHGGNSRWFHWVGSLRERARMLLLPRELLRLRGREVEFSSGAALAPRLWHRLDAQALTDYARLMTYLSADPGSAVAPAGTQHRLPALAPPSDPETMQAEIAALPQAQKLLEFRHYDVYYASAPQIPALMAQIARERERVFREFAEGSGAARDSDAFDASYVQLFVWDRRERVLVGAYRMGPSDELRARSGAAGMYLSQMFEFADEFYQRTDGGASLELGRSFIVPEHQRSFHALYLLWQGIGHYLVAHPRYRCLYGTVSLSRRYDERALRLLCDGLIQPTSTVRPRKALAGAPHPEWEAYLRRRGAPSLALLSALVQGLDAEGKDLPVLLKHYHKLGARFISVGVDPNFLDTPGLLLSVDVPALDPGTLDAFLGKAARRYLSWAAP